MILYFVSGYAGSGKSFAASCLQTLVQDSRLIAFGDAIKDGASKQYGIPRELCNTQDGKATLVGDHGETVRDRLIQYSAQQRGLFGESFFANVVAQVIQTTPTGSSWIIHDWRYPAEYDTLRTIFPDATFMRIRIVRTSIQSMPLPSEHALDAYPMDHSVYNDGTVDELMENLRCCLPRIDGTISLFTH